MNEGSSSWVLSWHIVPLVVAEELSICTIGKIMKSW